MTDAVIFIWGTQINKKHISHADSFGLLWTWHNLSPHLQYKTKTTVIYSLGGTGPSSAHQKSGYNEWKLPGMVRETKTDRGHKALSCE